MTDAELLLRTVLWADECGIDLRVLLQTMHLRIRDVIRLFEMTFHPDPGTPASHRLFRAKLALADALVSFNTARAREY